MKKLFPLFCLLFLSACGGDGPANVEAFNAEAFAYDIGDGTYDVTATVQVMGFTQNENNNEFTASLSYDLDIVKPNGETITSIVSKTEDKANNEKMIDTALEAQLQLDSTYSPGKYKVIFRVVDVLSGQGDTASALFTLE